MNARTIAALSLSAAMLLGGPVAGRGSASLFHRAVDPRGESEDVVPPRGDPDIFMTDPSAGAEKRDWMKFRTDACGQLLAIDSGRTTLRRTSLEDGDDGDDIDDMDGVDDGDPSDVGRTLIGRWLSQHPEIAVIGDGVDRACDDGPFLDEDLPSEIEALTQTSPGGPWERQPKRSGQSTIPRPTMLTAKTIVRITGMPTV